MMRHAATADSSLAGEATHPTTDSRPSSAGLHVLHVCDHLGWPGSRMHGAKRILEILLPKFDRSRFQVSLACLRHAQAVDDRFEHLGVPVTYFGRSKFDPRILTDLMRLMRAGDVDVLHAHGYGASTFGRLAGALLGVPCIVHEHANLPVEPGYQVVADWLLGRLTTYAIAVSESTRDFCIFSRKIPRDRTFVHYFGVSLDEFPPAQPGEKLAARQALGLPEQARIAGTATRLHPQKGNVHLIDAARLLADQDPEVLVVIAGEGPLQAELQARTRSLGLEERVRFLGFVDDPRSVYVASDVVVFASLFEGTPLTMFEAMAVGVPIVATAVDGIAEVLTDEHDALLVPPADPAALAAAIGALLADPLRSAALAEQVGTTVERYDVMRFVGDMEALYEQLAARRLARRLKQPAGA